MTTGQRSRYFESQGEKSTKFWEVTTDGTAVTVRYGKIGTNGQIQTKEFADIAAATKHVAKLVAEKTGKGYVESRESVVTGEASESIAEAAPRKKAAPARKTAITIPAKNPEASPESLRALLNKDDATNRLLARHPRASADLLEKLSHSSDKATRQAVTSNPATPPEIYLRLGQQFPKEFLANPALDLLLMVNPAIFAEMPEALVVRLLKHADCPEPLLTWAASQPQAKVQLAVAMNPKSPEQALENLRATKHPEVMEILEAQIREDNDLDPEKSFEIAVKDRIGSLEFNDLNEAWQCGDIGLANWALLPTQFRLRQAGSSLFQLGQAISKILSDTTWTLEEVRNLIIGSDVWCLVASGAKTPPSVLRSLAEDSNEAVRFYVAGNPLTPVEKLEELSDDKGFNIRWGVAKNPSTPSHVLEKISKIKDVDVQAAVAMNQSTPRSVLVSLANNKNYRIYLALINNPSTPPNIREDLIQVLSGDKNPLVRIELLKINFLSESVLEKYSKDRDSDIRRKVAQSRMTPEAVLEYLSADINPRVRKEIGSNENCPQDVLKVLAVDKDAWVRSGVAGNINTNPDILKILAGDSDSSVRFSVASNSSSPLEILKILIKDKDSMIRRGVAENSAANDILNELIYDADKFVRVEVGKNTTAPAHVLFALSKDKDGDVRAAIAANHTTPAEVLETLASDRVAGVVHQIIRNPNTPLSALISLKSSKIASVREALVIHAHRSQNLCDNLWVDSSNDVRLALLNNQDLDTETLDQLTGKTNFESEWVALLTHPNLSSESAQLLADKLFETPITESPWYRDELSRASSEVVAAAQAGKVLNYHGKDPNKSVLAKRALAALMALCAGPHIEPSRLVKVVGSTDWLVRAAVARNPVTPSNLIKKLCGDAHPLVAALAKRALLPIPEAHLRQV